MIPIRSILLLAVALFATGAWAQVAGRAQFVSGDVQVERGSGRTALARDAEVRQGDLLLTGADGNVQLVMVDQARISLRPRSRMRIERYEFEASKPGAGEAFLQLLTGAMHAFTGEIVERDRTRFKMGTPLATVGIRGSGNILAHYQETGTLNHTLTGTHIVTSRDPAGIERSLVSYPGQTIQVRFGQAPRYVPTPAFLMAAASPPTRAESAAAEKAPQASAQSAPPAAPASGSDSSSSSSSSSSASSSGSGTSSSSSSTASSAPGDSSSSATAASSSSSSSSGAAPAAATGTDTTASSTAAPSTSSTASTSSTSSTSSSASAAPASPAPATTAPTTVAPSATSVIPPLATSQAPTATAGSVLAAQPEATSQTVLRFFNPLPGGGYEGVVGQSSSDGTTNYAAIDANGHLVRVSGATVVSFLSGPGSPPPGYSGSVRYGTVTFSDGVHSDSFHSPDSSVILGRWTGGSVSVDEGSGPHVFDLGPRSVSYDVTIPTPIGTLGSFTGTATYSLAASTAPTDASGNTGSVNSASIVANFSSRTVNGNFGISIAGRSFALAGTSSLSPGTPQFTFASALSNLTITCSGNCSSLGYLGTMNGQFAGATAEWMSVSYRLNPNRAPDSGFSDWVIGSIALNSGAPPTVGIVLPQSGSASLAFTSVDPSRSSSTYSGAVGPPSITGTVQANFSSQTASFSATVSGTSGCGCSLPTFTANATGIPIVGTAFSASTDSQRAAGVGAMTLACTGSGCGSSPAGRFDGLFRNSAGTSGVASIIVGDSNGGYDLIANFGTPGSTPLVAADATAAAIHIAHPGAGAAPPPRALVALDRSRMGRTALP
jgi:hypothetical protein